MEVLWLYNIESIDDFPLGSTDTEVDSCFKQRNQLFELLTKTSLARLHLLERESKTTKQVHNVNQFTSSLTITAC